MKKNSFFKVTVASIFLATAVIIGCSKTGLNSFSEQKASGAVTEGLAEPGSGNPHFLVCPTIEKKGTQYFFSGDIAGLGNVRGSELKIIANLRVDPTCVNPSGKKVVPGQSKEFQKEITKTYITDQNGHFYFNESTFPILESDLGAVCPNGKWDLTFEVTLLNYTFYIDGVEVRKTTGGDNCY